MIYLDPFHLYCACVFLSLDGCDPWQMWAGAKGKMKKVPQWPSALMFRTPVCVAFLSFRADFNISSWLTLTVTGVTQSSVTCPELFSLAHHTTTPHRAAPQPPCSVAPARTRTPLLIRLQAKQQSTVCANCWVEFPQAAAR